MNPISNAVLVMRSASPVVRWIIIIAIASIYYSSGRLGQLIAMKPGFVTPIWPPAGVALAAVLLFGYKVWPGIFIGSFLNNFLLFEPTDNYSELTLNLFTATMIGSGAALQACVGGYLIRETTRSDDPLNTPENVEKFLFFALLSCLINSHMGYAALAINGAISWSDYLPVWPTWLLGDAAGIYIVTPLILSWVYHPLLKWNKWKILEVFLIILTIILVWVLIFNTDLPLFYLYLPILVWSSIRFGHAGATFVVALATVSITWGTANGMGPFAPFNLNIAILLTECMIAIATGMSLMLASTIAQRDKSQNMLQEYTNTLENMVEKRTKDLKEQLDQTQKMQHHMQMQERLAYLGEISTGFVREMKHPLSLIIQYAQMNKESLKDANLPEVFDRTDKTILLTHQVDSILERILTHTHEKQRYMQLTDINVLCEEYLRYALHESPVKHPWIDIHFKKEYDPSIGLINVVPQDIGRVLIKILDNANYAVNEKKNNLGDIYQPRITIRTHNLGNQISIIIRDNGIGIRKENLSKVFIPFFTTKLPEEGIGLGLSSTYDIIVGEHKGEIVIDSEEGEFTQVKILLPRIRPIPLEL